MGPITDPAMPHVKRSALLPVPAALMFEIVSDVPRYPEFLPWCADARLLEDDGLVRIAELAVEAPGLQHRFTTRNILFPHHRIELELVAGPFREFAGVWRFVPIGDQQGCRVELDLRFEFSGVRSLLGSAFSGVFAGAADRMVDAFCERGLSRR